MEEKIMATKSFTTDLTFTKDNVDNLIKALSKNSTPNRVEIKKIREVKDVKKINALFI